MFGWVLCFFVFVMDIMFFVFVVSYIFFCVNYVLFMFVGIEYFWGCLSFSFIFEFYYFIYRLFGEGMKYDVVL